MFLSHLLHIQLPQQSHRLLPLNLPLPSRSSLILPLGFDVTKLQEVLFHAALIWEAHYLCAVEAFKSISYVPYEFLRLYLPKLSIGFPSVYLKPLVLAF